MKKGYQQQLLKLHQQLDEIQDKSNPLILQAIFDKIASIYEKLQDYAEAIEWRLNSLKIHETLGNKNKTFKLHIWLGNLYLRSRLFDHSLEHYNKAGEIASTENQKAEVLLRTGNILTWNNKLQNAESLLKECLAKPHIKLLLRIQAEQNLATIYYKQKKYTEAIKLYLHCLEMLPEDKINVKCDILKSLALTYYLNNEYKKALKTLKSTEKILPKVTNKLIWLKVYEFTYFCYEELQQFDNALKYYKLYADTEKEIKEDKITYKLAAIEVNNKLIRTQSEREIFKQKNTELAEKNKIIEFERERSDKLLLNILPLEVANELKNNGKVTARHFSDVSILFTDFSGFTALSGKLPPQDLVNELDICFRAFDLIMEKYHIEKIKTIGDAYMAACGLPLPDKHHAEKTIKAAIEMRDFMENRYKISKVKLKMRIGVNSGNVIAGVVGIKKFAYDIWGDDVNLAARMESSGETGKINISKKTYELVKGKFSLVYRGKIAAKGKGEIEMYFAEPLSMPLMDTIQKQKIKNT
ncbi:MAG: hypothetical protein EA412_14625 [Chitinophagaceae bacterium]|nr:MAG: hypothetical protein EA412_14625 [Chitinophagaceae bacterium]